MKKYFDSSELFSKKRNLDIPEMRDFWLELRTHCPKSGSDWVKVVSVVVKPGKEIKSHSHPEWTILYYVEPDGTPIIMDRPYLPEKGEVVVLEPNLVHSVPKHMGKKDRVTLAMLVNE